MMLSASLFLFTIESVQKYQNKRHKRCSHQDVFEQFKVGSYVHESVSLLLFLFSS
jgi:hypothetical protein